MADGLLRAGVMPVSAFLRLRLLAGSVACCLAACGSEPAPGAGAAPLETAATETAVEPGPTVAPPAVTPSVGAPPDAIALLAPEARAALAAAPVPMLVLPADRARATTILTGDRAAGERWAALHFRDEALTISLHATDVSHPVVGDDEVAHLPPPPDTVRGRPARVLFNEQIRSVAWEEGPVSYALEVECARPSDDTRCTEPDFVLELADALVAAPRGAR